MSDAEKAALVAEMDAARRRIAAATAGLEKAAATVREKLDFPSRARANFERHKPGWIGGFALAGFLLARLRRPHVVVSQVAPQKSGIVWGAVKFAAGLAKPFLAEYAAKWIAQRAARGTKPDPQ